MMTCDTPAVLDRITVVLCLGASVAEVSPSWTPSCLIGITRTSACSVPGLNKLTATEPLSNGANGMTSDVDTSAGRMKSKGVSPLKRLAETVRGSAECNDDATAEVCDSRRSRIEPCLLP